MFFIFNVYLNRNVYISQCIRKQKDANFDDAFLIFLIKSL